MKRTGLISFSILAAMIAGMLCLQSCAKIEKNLSYDLILQTGAATIIIPSQDSSKYLEAQRGYVHMNIDSFIKANTQNLLGVSNIQAAHLTSCRLTLETDSASMYMADVNNNFANFQSVITSLSTNVNSQPYQVSVVNNSNSFGTIMDMPVNAGADLLPYFNSAKTSDFYYNLTGALRRGISKELKCTINYTFTLTVKG